MQLLLSLRRINNDIGDFKFLWQKYKIGEAEGYLEL